jgi:glycosyltransferase involved in cell wall biosynthesis
MEPALVSIVIPCFRQAYLLGEAIECALSQTYPNIEVIVVDDGSPDEPASVTARYPGVRFVQLPTNRGVSAARNAGVCESRGSYLVFLDAQDLLLPHAIDTGMRVLTEHPECAFVHGAVERRRLDGTVLPSPPPVVGHVDLYEALLRNVCVRQLAAVLFRRATIDAVGGFDESRRQAQDWDIYLRIAQRFPVYGHAHLVAAYRRTGQNRNHVHNAHLMLPASLSVLNGQRRFVRRHPQYAEAHQAGMRWVRDFWRDGLADRVREHVKQRRWADGLRDGVLLLRHYPRESATYALRKLRMRAGFRSARI